MKKIYGFMMGIILLGGLSTRLQAQDTNTDNATENLDPKKNGFTFGVGGRTMNLSSFNRRLDELQVGTLDPDLFSATVGFQRRLKPGLEFSMDVNVSATNADKVYHQGTYLSLIAFSVGATIHKYILQANRFALLLQLGYRNTSLNFEHKTNKDTPANFNTIFGSPTAASNIIRLSSENNRGIILGIRGQYRLGKNDGGKSGGYYLGFDTGYNYYVWTNAWREAGSNKIVADMPTVKPDNFYFQVTLSKYFN